MTQLQEEWWTFVKTLTGTYGSFWKFLRKVPFLNMFTKVCLGNWCLKYHFIYLQGQIYMFRKKNNLATKLQNSTQGLSLTSPKLSLLTFDQIKHLTIPPISLHIVKKLNNWFWANVTVNDVAIQRVKTNIHIFSDTSAKHESRLQEQIRLNKQVQL